VAVGLVEVHLPDVGSLKGKRHALKGLKERVRARYEVSVAEVAHHDLWQRATLAIACVSHDARHANEVVSKAIDFIEEHVEGQVIDSSVEII
jgi:uncharacterized protein YlxP (DUF503 family)